MRTCPFCGQPARTKEHVWPQWLRSFAPYMIMSSGRQGQRFQQTEYVPHRGALVSRQQYVAEFLPNVVADVCADCNSGWMAALENEVKSLLGPTMDVDPGRTFDPAQLLTPSQFKPTVTRSLPLPPLSVANQTLLATWFSKCVYAYSAAIRSEANRPWPEDEFSRLREQQRPPTSARIWIGRSNGRFSDIVLSLAAIQMIHLADNAPIEPGRPRMSSAWLSANGFVFFGIWMPIDMRAARLPERLAAPHLEGLRHVWPSPREGSWPSKLVSDDNVQALINKLPEIRDKEGVPIDELTPSRLRAVKRSMLKAARREGLDPPYAIVQRRVNEQPNTKLIEGESSPWPRDWPF